MLPHSTSAPIGARCDLPDELINLPQPAGHGVDEQYIAPSLSVDLALALSIEPRQCRCHA